MSDHALDNESSLEPWDYLTFESPGQWRELMDQCMSVSVDNYPGHSRLLREFLKKFLINAPETLEFGPEYHFIRSEKPQLKIVTLRLTAQDAQPPVRNDFCLIAFDEQGNVIGDRYQKSEFYFEEELIRTEGTICIDPDQRGKKYALPINLTMQHILDVEANRLGAQSIEWKVENANKKILLETLDKYEKTGDESLLPVIKEMDDGQKRWQSAYKKLGMESRDDEEGSYLSMLHPSKDGMIENLPLINSIELGRIDSAEGVASPQVLSYHSVEEDQRSSLRNTRMEQLRTLLEDDKSWPKFP